MPREAHRFVTLDGLRGIAAFVVVTTHAGNAVPFETPRPFLAVDFFFALSGFVLCYAYAGRLRDGLSPPAFLLIRLLRLYPLYILGTAIGILAWLAAGHGGELGRPAINIAAAILFLPSPASLMLYPF